MLLGHSFGGMVALAWASAWPDSVSALVLLSPLVRPEFRLMEHLLLAPRATPGAGPLFTDAAQETLDPVLLKALRKAMFAPQRVPERWEQQYPEELVLDAMVANGEDAAVLLTPSGLVDATRIRAPAHLLYGGEDRVVDPRRHLIPLSVLLKEAKVERLPGLGHMAHHFAIDEIVAAVDGLMARRKFRAA